MDHEMTSERPNAEWGSNTSIGRWRCIRDRDGSVVRILFDMQVRIEDNENMGFMGFRSVIDFECGQRLPGLRVFA
jgi:hypothetical protein